MLTITPEVEAVLERAAELRAEGSSWSKTATAMGYVGDDLKGICKDAGQTYERIYTKACRAVVREALSESMFVLRRLLREGADADSRRAAECLSRISMTFIRHRRSTAIAKGPKPDPRLEGMSEESIEMAKWLSVQTPADMEKYSDILFRRHKRYRKYYEMYKNDPDRDKVDTGNSGDNNGDTGSDDTGGNPVPRNPHDPSNPRSGHVPDHTDNTDAEPAASSLAESHRCSLAERIDLFSLNNLAQREPEAATDSGELPTRDHVRHSHRDRLSDAHHHPPREVEDRRCSRSGIPGRQAIGYTGGISNEPCKPPRGEPLVPRRFSLVAVMLFASVATAQPAKKALEVPTSADPRLEVKLFAAAPDIVQPISLDFDAKGRLLVVESHTHFRPANYTGPKTDRIRMFEDTDGDGKADKITTFFEGVTHTMDLAVHPDGSVYVATRNEILRLRDTKGMGTADEKSRIAFLDTKGNYPHNGLAGLSFDSRGDLTFGIGENLGEPYKLIGADGTTLTGGGEGGNVYHITADGKKLRRVATGFWNPFGSGRDIFGRLFVVDNDPDASPPCRLLHVVEGGDYGFQFRYGRAGRHPFQAWNGELPGTLPMVAGTGESPCEVISYESDGLPAEYLGNLLVPAWADHRLERYVLKPNGASFTGERKPFILGGKEFYPSGLTVAPDGSLFVSDWGSRSYPLHGNGAIWQVRMKDAKPTKRPADPKEAILSADRKTREAAARELVKGEAGRKVLREQLAAKDVRVRAAALVGLLDAGDSQTPTVEMWEKDPSIDIRMITLREVLVGEASLNSKVAPEIRAEVIRGLMRGTASDVFQSLLTETDPFIHHAVVQRLALAGSQSVMDRSKLNARQRIGLLLAWRASGDKDATKQLPDFLKDADPDVRFLAIKWVSDEKLVEFRPQIVEMLKSPNLDPRAFIGLSTTLARLDDKPVNDDNLAVYFLDRLADKTAPANTRLMALRAIPANHKRLAVDPLLELLKQDDPAFRIEAMRALKDRADSKATPAVLAIAKDVKQPVAVRAQALVTLAAVNGADADFLIELVSDNHVSLSQEALRALVQVKLTPAQQEKLTTAAKGKDEQLVARVLGKPINAGRPAAKDVESWLKRVEGPGDPEAGRRIFEHPKLAGCYKCHQVEGRGANVGPELSLIGRTERKWIVESILQPSNVVAPHYQAWKIETTDGRTLTGLLVGTYLDVSEYIDEKGNRFKVSAGDVENIEASQVSIMPEGLFDNLTDQEIRDLLAYLLSRK